MHHTAHTVSDSTLLDALTGTIREFLVVSCSGGTEDSLNLRARALASDLLPVIDAHHEVEPATPVATVTTLPTMLAG